MFVNGLVGRNSLQNAQRGDFATSAHVAGTAHRREASAEEAGVASPTAEAQAL